MKKRLLSLLLVGVIAFTSMPMEGLAAEVNSATEADTAMEESGTEAYTQSAYTIAEAEVIGAEAEEDGESVYTYSLSVSEGETVATITGYSGDSTEIEIPSEIDGYRVTAIGSSAFADCSSLTEVVLPDSLTSVGDSAFRWCSSLTKVTFPDGLTSIGSFAFEKCSSLTEVVFPDSLKTIGSDAFSHCTSLSNVTFSDSLETIGSSAFAYCSSLTEADLPDSLTSIDEGVFSYCTSLRAVTFPDSLETIGWDAFIDCSSLTEADLPDSLTSIGTTAFRYCSSLRTVTLPESLTSIGNYAFEGCSSLEEVDLPDGLESIEPGTFYGCSSLTKVTFPDSLTSIGDFAFEDCSSLLEAVLPSGLTALGYGVFWGCSSLENVTLPEGLTSLYAHVFYQCTSLTRIILPESLTLIDESAFEDCESLESITVPDSVTSIGDRAFQNCTGLREVTLSNNISSIGSGLFRNCTSLTEIVIPETVTSIAGYAFYGCTSLGDVTLPAYLVSIGGDAFSKCTNLGTLVIPESVTSMDSYSFYACDNLTLYVLPGSYALEYAISNDIPYALVANSTLTVNFEDIANWDEYMGMRIVVASDEQKVTQKITDDTSYQVIGLISTDSCTVSVINSYGDTLAEAEIALASGENEVVFSELQQVSTVKAHVCDASGNDVTSQVTVYWLDGDDSYAVGSSLSGIPVGKTLNCSIKLNGTLGRVYETPENTSCTVTESETGVTIRLKEFDTVMVTGTILDEDGNALAGASVSIVQELNGKYSNTVTAISDSNGYFSAEIYAVDAGVTITAKGYGTLVSELESPTEDTDLGDMILELLTGPEIDLDISYQSSVRADVQSEAEKLTSWKNLDFSIYNITTGAAVSEMSRQDDSLVLGTEVSAGDELEITISSLENAFAPVTVTVTVGNDKTASGAATLVEYGGIYASWSKANNDSVMLAVYNASGKLAWSNTSSGLYLQASNLEAGSYTVLLAGYEDDFVYPQSLSAWASSGFEEDVDYVTKKITVADGVISDAAFEEVPLFDSDSFSYCDLKQSVFSSSKSSLTTGAHFTLRMKADVLEEYAADASDFKWVIELPDDCTYLAGTLSVSGQDDAELLLDDGYLEISVDDPSNYTRICLLPTEEGEVRITGYLEFTLNGQQVRQTIGTVAVACDALEFTMSEYSNSTTVPVSGTGAVGSTVYLYDNDVLVGQTKVNGAGKWYTSIELYQPYTYSTHEIYAELVTILGNTVRTSVKELVYQYYESPISVKQVSMVNYGHKEQTTVFSFDSTSGITVVSYDYNPSYPTFTFLVEFEGEDMDTISNVQLTVTCTNGSEVRLYPSYDESQGLWVAKGDFYSSALPVSVTVGFDQDGDLILSSDEMEEKQESLQDFYESLEALEELGAELEELDFPDDDEAQAALDVCLEEKQKLDEMLDEFEEEVSKILGTVVYKTNVVTIDNSLVSMTISTDTSTVNTDGLDPIGTTTDGGKIYTGGDGTKDSPTVFVADDVIITTYCPYGDVIDFEPEVQSIEELLSDSAEELQNQVENYKNAASTLGYIATNDGQTTSLTQRLLLELIDLIPFLSDLKAIAQFSLWINELDDIWNNANCSVRIDANILKGFTIYFEISYVFFYALSITSVYTGQYAFSLASYGMFYLIGKGNDWYYNREIKKLRAEAENVGTGCDCGKSGCKCGCDCDVCPGGDGSTTTEDATPDPSFRTTSKTNTDPIEDPSGYVYEAVASNRLEGVTVTIYQSETLYDIYDEAYEEISIWDASEYSQENPLTTNSEGEYAWDVPEGYWQVRYEKDGYVTTESDWLQVPPPQMDVNVGLVSYAAPELESIVAYTDAVEITFSKYMQSKTLTDDTITVLADGIVVEGTITLTNEEVNPEDDSETFTSVVTFVPTSAIPAGSEITVEVADSVRSYAGTKISSSGCSGTATAQARSESFTADSLLTLEVGERGEITICALPADVTAGMTVTVSCQTSILFSAEETEVTLDEDGKAVVHVNAAVAGESVIVFTLGNTGMTAETVVQIEPAPAVTPQASVESGEVERGTEVTLTTTTRDATIYYTLDGSSPDSSSTRQAYDGTAIVLEEDCTLMAIAVKSGLASSEVAVYEYTVYVVEVDLSDCEITLETESYTYDGTAKEPAVTVSYDGTILTADTDYTVSYSSNIDVGTATVTVTGAGNYIGTITKTFTITKANQTVTASASPSSMIVGGTSTITASGIGTITYLSNDTSVATVSSSGVITAVSKGSATITVTAAGNSNYNSAAATVTITVAAADISSATVTLAATSYTYDGKAKSPSVTVKYAGRILTKDTDYTVAYSSNTNAGTATVTITGKGNYTGTITKNFTIAKASQTITAKAASSSIKAGKTTTITASGTGTITYSSSDTSIAKVSSSGKVTGVGVGTATITVKAAGNSNYKSATKTVKIKVSLSTPSISSVKQSNTTVTVKWSKIAGAKGYYVYRSTSKSSGYKKIATVTGNTTVSYKDTASKTNGKTYYYKVYAYSGSTKSSASSAKSLKYMKGTVSSLTNTSSGITVKWSKVSGATGYYVYRKASGASKYTLVTTIKGASTVSYKDTAVKSKNGTTYTYYVQPYNSTSKGAYATKKTVRLTGVSISSVKNSSSKKMKVTWKKNSKATGYQIQYSTSSSFASSKTKTVTVSKTATVSRTIGSLTKGKTYYVRIRTYKKVSNTKYYSAWSTKKSVKISK